MTPIPPSSPSAPALSSPRCVALCPRQAGSRGGSPRPGTAHPPSQPTLPDELRDLLGQRHAVVECFTEALSALAALVVNERGFAAGEHRDPMLLILIEPERLTEGEALVAAASKYAHHAAVWQYDPSSPKRLARYTAPMVNAPRDALPSPARPSPNGASNARPVSHASGTSSFVSWGGGVIPGNVVMMSGATRPAAPVGPSPKLRLSPSGGDGTAGPESRESRARGTDGNTRSLADAAARVPVPTKPELSEEEIAMLLDPRDVHRPASGVPIDTSRPAP